MRENAVKEKPAWVERVEYTAGDDEVIVVIAETRYWGVDGEVLLDLQSRIEQTLSYTLDGRFAKDHPQVAGRPLCLRVEAVHAPGLLEQSFMEMLEPEVRAMGVRVELVGPGEAD